MRGALEKKVTASWGFKDSMLGICVCSEWLIHSVGMYFCLV